MTILGFTWGDAGALVGGALGGALLGPPGAMLGSAVGSFTGTVWGDHKGTGMAVEQAMVAGIGAAGGAWAMDLTGKLVTKGMLSKALRSWNTHDAGLPAALGGAIGGYEASPKSRLPVTIRTTDIGNGGCPASMTNLLMPEQLSPGVGDFYRQLPGYLCTVWRSFGSGHRPIMPTPVIPAAIANSGNSGIARYTAQARLLDDMVAGFAALDKKVAALAGSSATIAAQGRTAVRTLIETVNRGAATTPSHGVSEDEHALRLLNDALETGREILSEATASLTKLGAEVDDLTKRLPAPSAPPRDAPPSPGTPQTVSPSTVRAITTRAIRTPWTDRTEPYTLPDGRMRRVPTAVARALDAAFDNDSGTNAHAAYADTTVAWMTGGRPGIRVEPHRLTTGDVAVWTGRAALVVPGEPGSGAAFDVIVAGRLRTFRPAMCDTAGEFGDFLGFFHPWYAAQPPRVQSSSASAGQVLTTRSAGTPTCSARAQP